MATTAIRNTAAIPATENRGESKFRSIYNAIAHVLEPYFGPGDLEMLAERNRSRLDSKEISHSKALSVGNNPF